MLSPQAIVDEIGHGVKDALELSNLWLGVERSTFKTADIHPEYVTTVKVAERLMNIDREIAMEAHMDAIRQHLGNVARLHAIGRPPPFPSPSPSAKPRVDFKAVDAILAAHRFHGTAGKKKSAKRIDILVKDSDATQPPLLMVEAKLGISNIAGVKSDVDRLINLLHMHEKVGLHDRVYGAVVFHLMADQGDAATLSKRGSRFAAKIQAHIQTAMTTYPWLVGRAEMISRFAIVQSATTYDEHHDDGTSETMFAKAGYAFAPGLVLLGANPSIRTVSF